jgi:hypothetical protein
MTSCATRFDNWTKTVGEPPPVHTVSNMHCARANFHLGTKPGAPSHAATGVGSLDEPSLMHLVQCQPVWNVVYIHECGGSLHPLRAA